MLPMLTRWRRHTKYCPHYADGRKWHKCQCPIWCDGVIKGQRVRESLDTRDWTLAGRKLAKREQEIESGRSTRDFADAVGRFLGQLEVESSTLTKYTRWGGYLLSFSEAQGITTCDGWTLESLYDYRAVRDVSALTWSKELQFLRQLFGFFLRHKWVEENIASAMKMPPEPKPSERVPYTPDEMAAILRACDEFGRHPYERLRARAIILLMRHYGLRISNASTLERSRVAGNQILIRAVKNGAVVWAPLYPEVRRALDMLPIPRGAEPDSPYFFWAGPQSSTPISFVKTMERTLRAVFDRSGVKNAHSHRFRHTLATELMAHGSTVEDVANILGDDPETIRKYYLKWSPEYQRRTTMLLDRVHGFERGVCPKLQKSDLTLSGINLNRAN